MEAAFLVDTEEKPQNFLVIKTNIQLTCWGFAR